MVLRSTSVTLIPSRAQKYAVAQPTIPPPTTTTERLIGFGPSRRRIHRGDDTRSVKPATDGYAAAMYLGIDHLVIAVTDPDGAVTAFERAIGPAPTGGGRHDALGTFNRVVWLGETYIELISVFDPVLAEDSWVGRPALRALEAGGGFATWAIATDDLDGDLAGLRAGGSSLGDARSGERRRGDGALVRWRLAAAETLGPLDPPFLI